MKNTILSSATAILFACLTACGSPEQGTAGAAPFPQARLPGSNWEDDPYSLAPELEPQLTAHMAEPVRYVIGTQYTGYGLAYDPHYARELEAFARFGELHLPSCENVVAITSAEVFNFCGLLVHRIFERSGRLRGTQAFVQRNYINQITDTELESLREELTAIRDGLGEIYEKMRMDSSLEVITRQQHQEMQATPGVLDGTVFTAELRALDDYLAFDEERQSAFRAAARDWVGAE